jgi:hypothetical protein
MTRLRPPGAGPGPRALLSATALGALLVTVLALSFSVLVAGSQAHPLARRAVASADVGARTLLGDAERAIALYAAAHDASYRGASAHALQRYDAAISTDRTRGGGWLSRVVVLDRGRGYALAVTAANGDRYTNTFTGSSETSSASGALELRPRRRR